MGLPHGCLALRSAAIRRERGIGAAGIVIVSRRVSVGAQLLNTVLCVDYGVVIHVPLWYCMGSGRALVRRGRPGFGGEKGVGPAVG